MNEGSEEIARSTGVNERTMDLIDVLTVAAMKVGADVATGDGIDGDPVYLQKLALATYISLLEQALTREATAKGLTPDQLGASVGEPPALPTGVMLPYSGTIH